ncbi:MAG TPA: ABC transporter ATP-binding protein [Gemmatimonadaceae bacterium]|nr:ABC transporter ATP-binding protein [Gemmatimonadaceae bacterium]
MSGRTELLELRGLSRRFGDFVALDDVNLSVHAGEFLTVLGASGSGKTTTLRLIAGFDIPTAGAILMDGVDLAPLPPFRRPVNTVFQHYALFPHMTVRDNVGYGLRMQKVAPAEITSRVDEALAMVRLAELGGRMPKQLSGGQQQRVALARALVNRPRVLLLDEPLGALDLKLRREMQLELKQLQTQVGITFIYVTHDQEEALTMSDRIVLMRAGRIEQVGTPREMYDCPRTRYVADFIGDTNLLRIGGNEISIRPEHIQLAMAGDGKKGVIDAVTFVGSTSRVGVRLSDGQTLVALTNTPPEIGAAIIVRWDTSRAVIVRE